MTDPTLTRLRLLEDALRALGINPDADPLVTAKRWTVESDADRRERSKAEAGAAALQDRLTDEMDRRRDVEQALAKMTDAHAVVSQRLIGSQKEVAEITAERDRMKKQAAAMRVSFAEFERRGEQIATLTAERDEATARADKVESRLRRDDALRAEIAVAVGLDDSASLALILDTVRRDRPGREISRLSGLLDVLAAPVLFGERRLSTAERAEWALRRALRERDECAPRMAQLIEAEVLLDTLGVPAYAAVPGDDPGDASEALTVAERLRLHFGARKDP